MANYSLRDYCPAFRDNARVNLPNVGTCNMQGESVNFVNISAAYTAQASDDTIACTSSSAYTVTLPQGSSYAGKIYTVIKDNGANAITVQPASGLIGGAASVTLAASAVHGVCVQSDGTNYWILSQF